MGNGKPQIAVSTESGRLLSGIYLSDVSAYVIAS